MSDAPVYRDESIVGLLEQQRARKASACAWTQLLTGVYAGERAARSCAFHTRMTAVYTQYAHGEMVARPREHWTIIYNTLNRGVAEQVHSGAYNAWKAVEPVIEAEHRLSELGQLGSSSNV